MTLYVRHALLNRGRLLGTLSWRSRVWRLQPWLVTTAQEARSPSAPDEGAAFNGWTREDEGQRQRCLDHGSGSPHRSDRRSTETAPKIATVERREARVLVTRHAAPQGAK